MRNRPYHALLIGDGSNVGRLQRALAVDEGAAVVRLVSFETVAAVSDSAAIDLLFLEVRAAGADWPEAIARLRSEMPDVPLIAIIPAREASAILALQAGAQDCVSESEIDGAGLARTARYAIERHRFMVREGVHHKLTRERQSGGLDADNDISAALADTGNSVCIIPLQQCAPNEFQELVRRYSGLLDRALLGRLGRDYDELDAELRELAGLLGLSGAGPRDVVDLHKAAMFRRLEADSARKNRAYIGEGRLLLVQLMGHLVSHYRRLAWARRSTSQRRFTDDTAMPAEPAASGKSG